MLLRAGASHARELPEGEHKGWTEWKRFKVRLTRLARLGLTIRQDQGATGIIKVTDTAIEHCLRIFTLFPHWPRANLCTERTITKSKDKLGSQEVRLVGGNISRKPSHGGSKLTLLPQLHPLFHFSEIVLFSHYKNNMYILPNTWKYKQRKKSGTLHLPLSGFHQ